MNSDDIEFFDISVFEQNTQTQREEILQMIESMLRQAQHDEEETNSEMVAFCERVSQMLERQNEQQANLVQYSKRVQEAVVNAKEQTRESEIITHDLEQQKAHYMEEWNERGHRVQHLEKNLEEYEKNMESLRQELADRQIETKDLIAENKNLKQNVSKNDRRQSAQASEVSLQLHVAQQDLQKAHDEIEELKMSVQMKEEMIKELNKEKESLENEQTLLDKQVQELESAFDNALRHKQVEIDKGVEKNANLIQDRQNLLNTIREKDEEITDLKNDKIAESTLQQVDATLNSELSKLESTASADTKPDEFTKRNSITSQEDMGDQGEDDMNELEDSDYQPDFNNIYVSEDRNSIKKKLQTQYQDLIEGQDVEEVSSPSQFKLRQCDDEEEFKQDAMTKNLTITPTKSPELQALKKDPEEEHFQLMVLAVKMNINESDGNEDFVFEVCSHRLYQKVKDEKVPFHKWYSWIQNELYVIDRLHNPKHKQKSASIMSRITAAISRTRKITHVKPNQTIDQQYP